MKALCWICNKNDADSGEHKFKSSQLKQMHGKIFSEEILYGNESKVLRLEGPNNKKVKFPKVICQYCNNTITSFHDKAFDKLINWSNVNYDNLRDNHSLNFEIIYGENWLKEKRNLLKYMAKHAGCKVITGQHINNTLNLSNLIFLNLNTDSFQIKFIVKEGFNHIHKALKHNNYDGLKFISNSSTVYKKNQEDKIIYFAGMTTYNWLTIAWVYSQNEYKTFFDGFTNKEESIIFLPFNELPKVKENHQLISFIDNQNMYTLDDQIKFYDSFIQTNN